MVKKGQKKHSKFGYWVLVLVILLFCLYFAFKEIDWLYFLTELKNAKVSYIFIAFVISSFSFLLRSVRWKYQLFLEKNIPLIQIFWAISAGYLINNFIPARIGDVFRSVIIARKFDISKTFSLSTILIEKILDLVTLVLICSLTLLFIPQMPSWMINVYKIAITFILLCVIFFITLPFCRELFLNIVSKVSFLNKYYDYIISLVSKAFLGIKFLYNFKSVIILFVLSITIWFFDAFSALCIAQVFNFKMNLIHIFFLFTALGFASAIPSTPGSVGIFQLIAITVLSPFGFLREQALLFILFFQGVAYIVSIVWGSIALIKYFILSKIFLTKEEHLDIL